MKAVTAFVLAVAVVVAFILAAFLYDPVRQQAELGRQQALTAIEVQARQVQLDEQRQDAQRRAEFWQGVQPVLVIGAAAIVGSVAIGLPVAVGIAIAMMIDRRRRAAMLVYPDARGQVPLPYGGVVSGTYAQLTAAGVAGYHQAQIETAKRPVFSGAARSERIQITNGHAAPALVNRPPVEVTAPATSPGLPGPIALQHVLTWQPDLTRILIGLDQVGQPITVSARELCHVALVGHTGGGKSNAMRLLLGQLLAAGARAVLLDPHYAPFDPDDPVSGDWRNIEAKLYRPPSVLPSELAATFDWLNEELNERLARRRHGERNGAPMFCCIDELPSIVAQVDQAPDVLTRIVREGRKVGLLAITSSQDFLVKSIGTGSAARDSFRTAVYAGGDRHSAAVLLDMPQRQIDDGPLGKGVVMLRSSATATAGLARLPLVTDADLHKLLPMPTEASRPRPVSDFDRQPAPEVAEVGEVARSGRVLTFPSVQNEAREVGDVARSGEVDDRDARAIDLMRGTADTPPMSMTSAIATVFGVKGGEAFQRHAARLRARMLNGTGTDGN